MYSLRPARSHCPRRQYRRARPDATLNQQVLETIRGREKATIKAFDTDESTTYVHVTQNDIEERRHGPWKKRYRTRGITCTTRRWNAQKRRNVRPKCVLGLKGDLGAEFAVLFKSDGMGREIFYG
jgi:hypothetical protein